MRRDVEQFRHMLGVSPGVSGTPRQVTTATKAPSFASTVSQFNIQATQKIIVCQRNRG